MARKRTPSYAERRQWQLRAALAKPPRHRNFIERLQVKAAEQRAEQERARTGTATKRTYASDHERQLGVAQMTRDGWRVVAQSTSTPRTGLARTLAGSFLFFHRTPRVIVTYTRG